MCVKDGPEPNAALAEKRECCSRIAAALDKAIGETSALGDDEMLLRLRAAKSAADRATELVCRIADYAEMEPPFRAHEAKRVS